MDGSQEFLYVAGGVVAFTVISELWARRRRAWAMVDAAEQNLRRISQGAAVIAFTVGVPVYAFGLRSVLSFLPHMTANRYWPLLAGAGLVVTIGTTRLLVGISQLAGFRDPMRSLMSLVRLGVGVGLAVYLRREFPSPDPFDWFGFCEFIGPFVGVWIAVIGGARCLALALPRSVAYWLVKREIEDTEFTWTAKPDAWWQFWKRGR